MTQLRCLKTVFLGVAIVSGIYCHGSAEAVTVFAVDINRTSADREALTFSGNGLIGIDIPASGVAEIISFSLGIKTTGETLVSPESLNVLRHFVFGLSDVMAVASLSAESHLSGVIELASKVSLDGDVELGKGTTLDFTAGVASGFCFSLSEGEHCIAGGGSSSAIDAELTSAIVPLPSSLSLLMLALGGLGVAAGSRTRWGSHPLH